MHLGAQLLRRFTLSARRHISILLRSQVAVQRHLRRFLRIVRFSFYRKCIRRSLIGLHCCGVVYVCVVVFRTLFAMVSARRAFC